MARAMVLCAGLGTRLRPLTEELPKPLVPIGDRSILAHIAAALQRAGFLEAVLNTHHLPYEFTSKIGDLPIKTHLIHEPVIRGTAGGVAGALGLLGSPPIVVYNGDIWVEAPLAALLSAIGGGPMALAVTPRALGEGVLGVGGDGRVVRLRGEVFGAEAEGGDFVGVYALGVEALASLPVSGCLIGDLALPLLRRGASIPTVAASGSWSDVGSIAGYLDANQRWLDEHAGSSGSFAGEGATIGAEVRLLASVVGREARIEGSGEVVRSVIWPGAVARAPLRDSVVTTAGRVVERRD